MNKTRIEWCDFTINPVKGLCPMACPYCYARRMYKRFKWNPEIRMEPDWMEELPKKPARVFLGSTMELFGDWVEEWMWDSIWQYVNDFPQHTFIFLTKMPQNLPGEFPKNCWVGVSATNDKMFTEACVHLQQIHATVKFVSFEPLIGHIGDFHYLPLLLKASVQWVIIGAQTPYSAKTAPRISWVKEIVEAADQAGVPVFLKQNIYRVVNPTGHWEHPFYSLVPGYGAALRQEFPQEDMSWKE